MSYTLPRNKTIEELKDKIWEEYLEGYRSNGNKK